MRSEALTQLFSMLDAISDCPAIKCSIWSLHPAVVPQLIVGLRIAVGISWLVVVAAEMIAVNSGLGFLIIDARNSGNRYEVVVPYRLHCRNRVAVLDTRDVAA